MATLTVQAGFVDSNVTMARNTSKQVTVAGNAFDYRVIDVTTGEFTFTISTEVGNAGYCYVRNTDATNYVQLGFATGSYFIRLLAGQAGIFPIEPAQAALFLLADTATCECEVYVHEV